MGLFFVSAPIYMSIKELALTLEQYDQIVDLIKSQGGEFYHLYSEPSPIEGSGVYLTHEGELVSLHGSLKVPISAVSRTVEYSLTCGDKPEQMFRAAGIDLPKQPRPQLTIVESSRG